MLVNIIQRSIDNEMVKAYWFIGREIVEEEQFGQERATYGQAVLKGLSAKLNERYKNLNGKNGVLAPLIKEVAEYGLVCILLKQN